MFGEIVLVCNNDGMLYFVNGKIVFSVEPFLYSRWHTADNKILFQHIDKARFKWLEGT